MNTELLLPQPGALYQNDGKCTFTVWCPLKSAVTLKMYEPDIRCIPMKQQAHGYWSCELDNAVEGLRYSYVLDNSEEYPDPASFYQPDGVHQPSAVIDHNGFVWEDEQWKGIGLHEYIFYEIHVGTFTSEATFDAVIDRLDALIDLGITAIELMPVAQFPGQRNWGYDGAYPFAVQNSYGGPDGLKRLVNSCHKKGLAVVLDVVYNHLGPEGNYLWAFGPYFTDEYKTPWGWAINFDGPYSPHVRHYFVQNALYWFHHYHIDALRLDAVHGIFDFGAKHILRQLSETVQESTAHSQWPRYLIAESDLNDTRMVTSRSCGGYGIDAQWADDFHHSVHALLTGERSGYYQDFGSVNHLGKALATGFVYTWNYSAFRKRYHGSDTCCVPADSLVVCIQNHDQIGNRFFGERLSSLVSFEALKLAAGVLLTSPYLPLLFMGDEFAETAPFLYFVSHGDKELIEAVRKGRKEEFAAFQREGEPPDPESEETFLRSKITWDNRNRGASNRLLLFYRSCISLRKTSPALKNLNNQQCKVIASDNQAFMVCHRWCTEEHLFIVMNFGAKPFEWKTLPLCHGAQKVCSSKDGQWNGPGDTLPQVLQENQHMTLQPFHFSIYRRE